MSSETIIAKALVQVGLDTTAIQSGTTQIEQKLKSIGAASSKINLSNLKASANQVGESLSKVVNPLSAITTILGGGAIAAFLKSGTASAKEFQGKIDNIRKAMANLGGRLVKEKIFGRDMYEWADRLSQFINRIDTSKIARLIELVVALKAISSGAKLLGGLAGIGEQVQKTYGSIVTGKTSGFASSAAGTAIATGLSAGVGSGVGSGVIRTGVGPTVDSIMLARERKIRDIQAEYNTEPNAAKRRQLLKSVNKINVETVQATENLAAKTNRTAAVNSAKSAEKLVTETNRTAAVNSAKAAEKSAKAAEKLATETNKTAAITSGLGMTLARLGVYAGLAAGAYLVLSNLQNKLNKAEDDYARSLRNISDTYDKRAEKIRTAKTDPKIVAITESTKKVSEQIGETTKFGATVPIRTLSSYANNALKNVAELEKLKSLTKDEIKLAEQKVKDAQLALDKQDMNPYDKGVETPFYTAYGFNPPAGKYIEDQKMQQNIMTELQGELNVAKATLDAKKASLAAILEGLEDAKALNALTESEQRRLFDFKQRVINAQTDYAAAINDGVENLKASRVSAYDELVRGKEALNASRPAGPNGVIVTSSAENFVNVMQSALEQGAQDILDNKKIDEQNKKLADDIAAGMVEAYREQKQADAESLKVLNDVKSELVNAQKDDLEFKAWRATILEIIKP
jgi:hypothetical protein